MLGEDGAADCEHGAQSERGVGGVGQVLDGEGVEVVAGCSWGVSGLVGGFYGDDEMGSGSGKGTIFRGGMKTNQQRQR